MDDLTNKILSEEMNEYFTDIETLRKCYITFKKCRGSYDTISQIVKEACGISDISFKKLFFALNVFCEQKLIAFSKSDKITLKYNMDISPNFEIGIYSVFKKKLFEV